LTVQALASQLAELLVVLMVTMKDEQMAEVLVYATDKLMEMNLADWMALYLAEKMVVLKV
jgi:hypothetical protein